MPLGGHFYTAANSDFSAGRAMGHEQQFDLRMAGMVTRGNPLPGSG